MNKVETEEWGESTDGIMKEEEKRNKEKKKN